MSLDSEEGVQSQSQSTVDMSEADSLFETPRTKAPTVVKKSKPKLKKLILKKPQPVVVAVSSDEAESDNNDDQSFAPPPPKKSKLGKGTSTQKSHSSR